MLRPICCVLLVCLVFSSGQVASAAFKMKLESGGDEVIISDDVAGDLPFKIEIVNGIPTIVPNPDAAPGDGQATTEGLIQFTGGVGAFETNITTALSTPHIGNDAYPALNTTTLDISGGAGVLVISITDTDFGPSLDPLVFINLINATAVGGTVSYNAYIDRDNIEFGTEQSIGSMNPADEPFSFMQESLGSTDGSYSVTMVITIEHFASTFTSLDATLYSNPEPAALAVWSVLGLVGISAATWRRRKKRVA